MDYAVVSTKRSSLKVYTTSNTAEKNLIGSLPTGTKVELLDHRIINNVEWMKVKTDTISGWVIAKHPSISYPFLELPIALMAMDTNTIYNASVTRNNNTSSVASAVTAANNGTKTATAGKVKVPTTATQSGNTYTSNKVSHPKLSDVNGFSFGGSRTTSDKENAMNLPQNVQNSKGYPSGSYDSSSNMYKYDYETDYSNSAFIKAVNSVKKSINLQEESSIQLFERYAKYYNRFKVATPDDVLTKTFAHVFFTRPDLNIIASRGSGSITLTDQVKNNPDYKLVHKNNPSVLMQLCLDTGWNHDFMMLPSNRVTSFECKDRNIKSDTYGKSLHGNSIAYGRLIDESQAAGELSISFNDDRDLNLFRMHHFWVNYISGVNKGTLRPKQNYLNGKILDYACSAYYIVCAENGEDIIYWSKLYGVFPTNIPDSGMTWTKSQYITNPEISIQYQYSFKKDWSADIIAEFNLNSSGERSYLETYDRNILSTGNTWVGAPYIELLKDNLGRTVYKLRFRQK